MAPISLRPRQADRTTRTLLAIVCAALLVPGEGVLLAQDAAKPATTSASAAGAEAAPVKLPPDQLDSLVAPIALFPDPILAQTLVASTYPLEIVQLQQWLAKNPKLKDKALADAVAKQPWDPAIQSMAAVPDVVKRLADDIQWTTQLGDAFLDQQSDVMDAVQRMRKKAEGTGALKSNEQQNVETKVVEEKTVIVVQPTNPEVVYVPSYSPVAVYGPPIYPYPPVYYPPYYAGAALVSFGVGMAIGAAVWGGSCCGCGWGGTTSTSTSTTISTGTRTSTAATCSTTPSTAAGPPTRTRPPRTSTAGRLAVTRAVAAAPPPDPWIAEPAARGTAALRPVRWTAEVAARGTAAVPPGSAGAAGTGSATRASRAAAARRTLSAAAPAATAEAAPGPAARVARRA